VPHPKVKLSDDSGNAVSVTSNRLDVNAYLSATPTIDIGDVSLLLGGTAASTNVGANTDQTLRVTMAVDDTLTQTLLGLSHANEDDGHTSGDKGIMALGVRNNSLSTTFSSTDGDYTPIAVDSAGQVYVTDIWNSFTPKQTGEAASTSGHYGIGALAVRHDSLSAYAGIDEGDYTFLQVNASGALYVDIADGGQLDTIIDTLETTLTAIETDQAAIEALLITIDSDTDAIKTAVQILDDWDDSNYANVNINLAGSDAPTGGGAESGALRVTLANDSTGVISIDDGGNTITVDGTVSVNSHAVTNAGTFAVQAGHDITGMVSGINADIDTSAEQLDGGTDGYDVACKRVDLKASPTNTDDIWVGDSGVLANGLGGGIRLSPGDFYSIDIDNLTDIWVIAISADQAIHFNYFT